MTNTQLFSALKEKRIQAVSLQELAA